MKKILLALVLLSGVISAQTTPDFGQVLSVDNNGYQLGVSNINSIIGGTATTSTLTFKTTTGIGATGADHIFQVGNNGATEAVRILNSGVFRLPTYTTNGIVRATSSNGTITSTGVGIGLTTEVTGILPIANGGTGSSTQSNWTLLGNAGTVAATNFIGTTDAIDFRIRTNNTDKVTVLSGGNVGIGTTAPSQKLHVAGNIQMSGNPASARYVIIDETNTGTTQFITQAGGGSATFGGAMNLFGHSHSTKSGWVTAGISSGAGAGATEGRFTVNNSALGGGTDVFTVLRTGNVGIGITAPTSLIHAYSSTVGVNERIVNFERAGATGSAFLSIGAGSRYFDLEQNGGSGGPFRYGTYIDANLVNNYAASGGAFGNINFVTGDAGGLGIAMTIGGGTQKGNVGIGTTTPAYKLEVVGTLNVTGIPTIPTASAGTNTTQAASTAFVTTAMTGVANIYEASLSLTSAQILDLFTTPIQIVPAPGAGKYIEFISSTASYTFVTAAYATNTQIQLKFTGANNHVANNSSILTGTVDLSYSFVRPSFGSQTTATQVLKNTALNVTVATGNPTGGSGTIIVKMLYRIVTE